MNDQAGQSERGAPWFDRACKFAVDWLDGSKLGRGTRSVYAADLGVPRALWRWVNPPPLRRRSTPARAGLPYFTWCVAEGLDPFEVSDVRTLERWRDALCASGVSESVVVHYLAAINGWYRAAKDADVIGVELHVVMGTSNQSHAPRSQARLLTRDDVRALRFAASRSRESLRERNTVIVELLAVGGLWAADVHGLCIGDAKTCVAETSGRTITVGRGTKRRQVVLADSTVRALDRYLALEREGADDEPLLIGRPGEPMTVEGIMAVVARLCRALDVNAADAEERAAARVLAPLQGHVNAEALRRFAATTAQDAGAPVEVIGVWLGLRSRAAVEALLPVRSNDVAPSVLVAQALEVQSE